MTFETLGLAPELLSALEPLGYTKPTQVQAKVIPLVMEGKDVVATAQTGTGKTAAYALPLLHHLAKKTFMVAPWTIWVSSSSEMVALEAIGELPIFQSGSTKLQISISSYFLMEARPVLLLIIGANKLCM